MEIIADPIPTSILPLKGRKMSGCAGKVAHPHLNPPLEGEEDEWLRGEGGQSPPQSSP